MEHNRWRWLVIGLAVIVLTVGVWQERNRLVGQKPEKQVVQTDVKGKLDYCRSKSVDGCPKDCQVCPPCPECSSISCASAQYCREMGFKEGWYESSQKAQPVSNDQAKLANPASVNCREKQGVSEIRTGKDGGQVGYCVFKDGSECEEWALFRGECSQGK
jgi:putative hemolysin